MTTLLFVAAITLLSGVVQSTAGFGGAMTVMVFLPLVFDMLQAPTISCTINVPLSLSLLVHFRQYVSLRRLALPILSALVTSTLCINIATRVNVDLLGQLFGVFLILLAVYYFVVRGKVAFRDTPGCAILSGVISGLSSGLFAVGGPFMAAFYLATTDSKEEYIGTSQAYFVILGTMNCVTRLTKGLYQWSMAPYILAGMAGVLLGKKLGIRLLDRIDPQQLPKVVYTLIGISGVFTIFNHL